VHFIHRPNTRRWLRRWRRECDSEIAQHAAKAAQIVVAVRALSAGGSSHPAEGTEGAKAHSIQTLAVITVEKSRFFDTYFSFRFRFYGGSGGVPKRADFAKVMRC
jgi:hypothetical protein